MKSLIRNIVVVTMTCLFLAGCDDTYISSIPDYPVYLELDLVTVYPIFRNSTNKYLTFITGVTPNLPIIYRMGYGGIIVNSGVTKDDYGNSIYYAYDMSCPYEHKSTVRVYPNDLGQAVCEKCGTVFDIGYGAGNPTKRIRTNLPDTIPLTKEYLKRYRASFSNNVLYITR